MSEILRNFNIRNIANVFRRKNSLLVVTPSKVTNVKRQENPLPVGDPSKLTRVEGPTIMTQEGFETPVSVSIGKEEDILAALRARGYSEDAIAAFKSGKPIKMNILKVGDKDVILGEDWKGKKPEEGH